MRVALIISKPNYIPNNVEPRKGCLFFSIIYKFIFFFIFHIVFHITSLLL
nr:MAG TPA: hypothetical protein [Caudoviricetes sp.]